MVFGFQIFSLIYTKFKSVENLVKKTLFPSIDHFTVVSNLKFNDYASESFFEEKTSEICRNSGKRKSLTWGLFYLMVRYFIRNPPKVWLWFWGFSKGRFYLFRLYFWLLPLSWFTEKLNFRKGHSNFHHRTITGT